MKAKDLKHEDRVKHVFIQDQHHCVLCDTELNIGITVEDRLVIESAYCPNCEIKTRVKEHPLH